MVELTIPKPDDWHLHIRDGAMMQGVLPYTAAQFGRAIIMPNLVPPVVTQADARAYRGRIEAALPDGGDFEPLMVLYLTDDTDPADLAAAFEAGDAVAAKLYPAGATTNSASGVTDIANVEAVLHKMADIGMPLLIHGEVTDPETDIFDREHLFIEQILKPVLTAHPKLKVVLEHITTQEAVDFVLSQSKDQDEPRLAATITAHHLQINRTDIFKGGIRPHYYCLPIAKREKHRLALRKAATSGQKCFFLGTDSAPHLVGRKESSCGCAGIFTAPNALEVYTEVFDQEGALDQLAGFASTHGPSFYGRSVSKQQITLIKQPQKVAQTIQIDGEGDITPYRAGEELSWSIK